MVEWVVLALLELLANLVLLLVLSQALAASILVHLLQSTLLEGGICCLESSLGVLVNLRRGIRSQVESVERVVDTGSVERAWCLGGLVIELGEVETLGLLDSLL